METHVLPAIHQTHPCVCSAKFRIVSRLFCSYQDTFKCAVGQLYEETALGAVFAIRRATHRAWRRTK